MKNLFKSILVFGAILLVSAALSPLLHQFLPYKFEKIFNRLVMIFSLTALVVFLKGRQVRLSEYGLNWHGQPAGKFILTGFLTGVLVLVIFSLVKVTAGQAVWIKPETGFIQWGCRLVGALGAAFLIAIIEECFFRGFIYQTLSRRGQRLISLACGITSLFYALVHFVSFEKPFVDSTPGFIDGLRLVAAPFLSLLQFGHYWPEALGLFIFGLVLNHAAVQSCSLYPSIGLHAGCVFYVKTDALFLAFKNGNRLLFSSAKFYDGLLGWFFLSVIGIFLTAAIGRIQAEKARTAHD